MTEVNFGPYRLQEVTDRFWESEWLEVARRIYRTDPVWACPLDSELRDIFRPSKNDALLLKGSEAIRWVLLDRHGRGVGRIAAFVHGAKAYRFEQPTGGLGYFECVNDPTAAAMLFDAGRQWLAQRGMEAMDGPINLGENDRYSGLLVEGFTHPGFGMSYNPPYYLQLFEGYGFTVYYEQITKHLDISEPFSPRFHKIYEWVKTRPGVTYDYARLSQLNKYVHDFAIIYNDAWSHHEHYTPIDDAYAMKLARQLKSILYEPFLIFAYVNGEPAGFLFALPDLNQLIREWQGRPTLLQLLNFWWNKRNNYRGYLRSGQLNRARVTIMGVRPQFQKLGLATGLAIFNMDLGRKEGFREIELSWVGDFNPVTLRLQEASGAAIGKKHVTLRYLFDRSKPAQHPKKLAPLAGPGAA